MLKTMIHIYIGFYMDPLPCLNHATRVYTLPLEISPFGRDDISE